MPVRAARRLPGIRFETPAPPLDEVLPRMDIAAFVGFAASGPVHLPVAVESADAFEAIFGGRAPLAWDPRRGGTVFAQLMPAVRAFFRGGGRRCWVVRVAEAPAFNFFPIAGLVRVAGGTLAPAHARSRAAGSWSDAHRVAPAIMPSPIAATAFQHHQGQATVDATLGAAGDLRAGDVLRLEFESGIIAFVAADSITQSLSSPPSLRVTVTVAGRVWWFSAGPSLAGPTACRVTTYGAARHPLDRNETFAAAAIDNCMLTGRAGAFDVDVDMPLEDAPAAGSLMEVEVNGERLWLAVRDVGIRGPKSGNFDRLRISGRGLSWLPGAPAVPLGRIRRAERLSLELRVLVGRDETARYGDLGLAPAHARFWADLPDDNERYTPPDHRTLRKALRDEPAGPLAGAGPADAVYLPIDVPFVPERWLGAARQPRTPLERDGLSHFTSALFLDRDLARTSLETVLTTAEHIRYGLGVRKQLDGIHATIGIDEATILAVPDATQPGWKRAAVETPPPPKAPDLLPEPDWGAFIDCRIRVLDPPQWIAPAAAPSPARFDAGTFTLDWTGANDISFEIEEAHTPDWSDASVIGSGPTSALTLYGRPPGVYYYRIRAVDGAQTSQWSDARTVVVGAVEQWVTLDEREYDADTLLAVHRGLMRLAAARGDALALLSVPVHYQPGDAVAHASLLRDPAERRALSYAALYHPWAFVRERAGDSDITRTAPDGLAAGLIAKRALTRGAWVAPANDPLPNVVDLTPAIDRGGHVTLLEGQVNAIAREPRGVVPLSASTLSDEDDLEPINVRRLLSLLKRLALREGAIYVFEPNGDALRRGVQRGFESWLTRMFERGAFAGRIASEAFRVTTDATVNTPQGIDQGRFVVEIRVAPSRPMTFLTVRLVQNSDRAAVSEV